MQHTKKTTRCRYKKGFTLIEMMVSVALFTVVMAVATVALISIVDASKKAHALQSVMFNLNTAVDGMVRAIRMGTSYEIEVSTGTSGGVTSGTRFSFCPFGRPSCKTVGHADTDYKVTLEFVTAVGDVNRYRITKKYKPNVYTAPITTPIPITAKEVEISKGVFYITGTGINDDIQPRVTIVMHGTAGAEKLKTTTNFDIQASATQRLIDI